MGKFKFRCLICNQEFDYLTSHIRAKHPEFYRLQLEMDVQVFRKRQQDLEKLDPAIKQIPPGTIKHDAIGVNMQVNLVVQDGRGEKKVVPFNVYPKEVRDTNIDIEEFQAAQGWERAQFVRTALELLTAGKDGRGPEQEGNHQQLNYHYKTLLKGFTRAGQQPAPRREVLAALRDYCGEQILERQDRLQALAKVQAKITSGGYQCPTCSRTFKNSSGLTNHIRQLHADAWEKLIETRALEEKEKAITLDERDITARHSPTMQQEIATMKVHRELWCSYSIMAQKLEHFVTHGWAKKALALLREGKTLFKSVPQTQVRGFYNPFNVSYEEFLTHARELLERQFKGKLILPEIREDLDHISKEFHDFLL